MRVSTMIALVLGLFMATHAAAADIMSASDARAAALAGDVLLVDIRTPEEWAATGVADVAHPLNMHGERFVPKLKALMDANPGKPLALICATGGRSTYLAAALEQRRIEVINVREGMMGSKAGPGWLLRAMPVRRPDAPRVGD